MSKHEKDEHSIKYRPVVIEKPTYDILLKEKDALGLIALYNFYYYTAVWQETNQPKSTTAYAAKGLGISEGRIRRYKKQLIDLGFIEDIVMKDKKTNQVTGHYVKVNYYRRKVEKRHPNGFPQGGIRHSVENREGNAYNNNRKILKTNNNFCNSTNCKQTIVDNPISFDMKIAIKLNKLIQAKKAILRRIKDSTIAKDIQSLMKHYTKKQILQVTKWYILHYDDTYTPKMYKASSFKDNFPKLLVMSTRENNSAAQSTNTNTSVKVTKLGAKITSYLLQNHQWPSVVNREQLSAAVELSLINYNRFITLNNKLLKDKDNQLFAKEVKRSTYEYTPLEQFLRQWFYRVYKQVVNWAEWQGSFKQYIFSIYNKYFIQDIHSIERKYTGFQDKLSKKYISKLKELQT